MAIFSLSRVQIFSGVDANSVDLDPAADEYLLDETDGISCFSVFFCVPFVP